MCYLVLAMEISEGRTCHLKAEGCSVGLLISLITRPCPVSVPVLQMLSLSLSLSLSLFLSLSSPRSVTSYKSNNENAVTAISSNTKVYCQPFTSHVMSN